MTQITITYSSKSRAKRSRNPADLRFTQKFQTEAQQWGLTEKDARDVYYHGNQARSFMMVREYNGYQIGIYYFLDHQTGKPVITSIWKKDRGKPFSK